jgi:CheY-like chemotaxis protein
MDSVDLVRQMKQMLPHSVVIVMSRSADGGFLRAVQEAGADKFISKPFRFDDLYFVFGKRDNRSD